MKLIGKYAFLFGTGGIIYNLIELLYRGHTHWTMFFLGGLCFVLLGLLNEIIPWEMPLYQQALLGACMITCLEFMTGYVINIKLGWNIWDYSGLPLNFMGQICLWFFFLWIPISLVAIILDDWLRYWFFKQERPRYNLF